LYGCPDAGGHKGRPSVFYGSFVFLVEKTVLREMKKTNLKNLTLITADFYDLHG
jgi:hypothetical protein